MLLPGGETGSALDVSGSICIEDTEASSTLVLALLTFWLPPKKDLYKQNKNKVSKKKTQYVKMRYFWKKSMQKYNIWRMPFVFFCFWVMSTCFILHFRGRYWLPQSNHDPALGDFVFIWHLSHENSLCSIQPQCEVKLYIRTNRETHQHYNEMKESQHTGHIQILRRR